MSNIEMIELVKRLIAVLLVYFPTVAISGCFAAWVAKKFGDHTAENEGLLTLNPLEHVKLSGLAMLLLSVLISFPFIVGFGRYVPINEYAINQPGRKIKYLFALWAKSLANILMFCFATFAFIFLYFYILVPSGLITTYPGLIEALILIVMMFKNLNIISALMEFIFGFVFFMISILFPNTHEENIFLILLVQISLLILSWHFIEPYIKLLIISIDTGVAYFISMLIK